MSKIDDLVKKWADCDRRFEAAKVALKRAGEECQKAKNELGEFIAPADLGFEEKVLLWVRTGFRTERLVQVIKYHDDDMSKGPWYLVSFRGAERQEPEGNE